MNASVLSPTTWRKVKLGEVMGTPRPASEKIKTSAYKKAGRFPIIDQGSSEVAGYTDQADAEYTGNLPAILFGDHTLVVRFAKHPFALGADGVQVLEPDMKLFDRAFFYYAIKSLNIRSYGYERHLKYLREQEIYCPPIEAQRNIANALSAFDGKIENNNKIARTMEQMAQAIFKEWFKKEPRNLNLFELAEITYGFPFKSELFNETGKGKQLVRIRNLPDGDTSTFTTEKVDEKYLIEDGDILVGMDGQFHFQGWAGGEALLNQRVVRFRPKSSNGWFFLYLALGKPIKQKESEAVGTTVIHLSDKDLKSILLCNPNKSLKEKFDNFADPLYYRMIKIKKENQKLAALRDLLLPKLMSGEVQI